MSHWFEVLAAIALFLAGLRLSAFFSGAETGFYRLSLPRLGIEARAGNKSAEQLLWFAQNPAYFVATCLIGNNVANYVTTAAIGIFATLLFTNVTAQLDVLATLLFSPIIFQFGELLPKSVYYLTPMTRLQGEISWFRYFFRAFIVLSYPIVILTRQFEKISGQFDQPTEMVLGRKRLVQLMQHGHAEGVLTDIQSRLTNGLLQLAPQSVMNSMTPLPRVLGLKETASRQEFLDFAQKYGIPGVVVSRKGTDCDWFGYVVVSDLITRRDSGSAVCVMPKVESSSSKLEALHQLQCAQAMYGIVVRGDEILGIVSRNGLIGQIFRPEVTLNQRQTG